MLEQNLVWNQGSKIEKWCGIVWTQNGGKIRKTECDMHMVVKIKMVQNVCGIEGFLEQKAFVLWQYLLKVLEMCGMEAQYGSFIFEHATPLHS